MFRKTQIRFLGRDITIEKQHFFFYERFFFDIFFLKNPEEKNFLNNLAIFYSITCLSKPAQSQKNNVRAKSGWPVLFRYFADIE